MNNTYQKIIASSAWIIIILSFIPLSLEYFLFHIADYDIYKVLNISITDLAILLSIFVVQYLLLKGGSFHFIQIWNESKIIKNQKLFLIALSLFFSFIYSFAPSQFPFWIFLLLIPCLSIFYLLINYLDTTPFIKVSFILLFGAGLNSSLIFWMHEESNQGRHISYAQQLAEIQDTIAENYIIQLAEIGKNIPENIDKKIFWEKQWVNNEYLASNYRITVDEKSNDSLIPFFQPILTFNGESIPIYKVAFPENYVLSFKLNTGFRRSIYSPQKPFKKLKDLDDFQFAVIDKSRIILSNTHVYDAHILDIELPPLGIGEKIELEGFDVLAYRSSEDSFVLIGEPLSELQVWISNFALFFTLLLGVIIFLELINLLILKKRVVTHWQEQPIQYRIQIILIGITCLLFFIIATTTFIFLHQNNSAISNERQLYISKTLQNEILD